MATKKIKSDVSFEQGININVTPDRALKSDGSGNLAESTVTTTELEHLSGVTSSLQSQLDSKATLSGGKIPSAQLPAIAITEVFTAADITARDALTIGTGDGEVQEGDVVIVTDASADSNITSGSASYIYDGSAYQLLKAGDEVLSVNGQTGVVSLSIDDLSDTFDTENAFSADQVLGYDDGSDVWKPVFLNSNNLSHSQTDITDWTIGDGGSVGQHLDELADRVVSVEGATVSSLDDLSNVSGAGASTTADDVLKSDGAGNYSPAVLNSGNLSHGQTDTADFVIGDGGSVGQHINELGDRAARIFDSGSVSMPTANTPVSTGLAFNITDLSAEIIAHVDCAAGARETFKILVHNADPVTSGNFSINVESLGGNSTCNFTITTAGDLQIESTVGSTTLSSMKARVLVFN